MTPEQIEYQIGLLKKFNIRHRHYVRNGRLIIIGSITIRAASFPIDFLQGCIVAGACEFTGLKFGYREFLSGTVITMSLWIPDLAHYDPEFLSNTVVCGDVYGQVRLFIKKPNMGYDEANGIFCTKRYGYIVNLVDKIDCISVYKESDDGNIHTDLAHFFAFKNTYEIVGAYFGSYPAPDIKKGTLTKLRITLTKENLSYVKRRN